MQYHLSLKALHYLIEVTKLQRNKQHQGDSNDISKNIKSVFVAKGAFHFKEPGKN